MPRISPRHPRYTSLKRRARLAEGLRRGLVVPEGLIAHGRGEAFDYMLGERSSPSALRAEQEAAAWLWKAKRPVLSVNGNTAALAAVEVARLQRRLPRLAVEINLFHRTAERARLIASELRLAGVREVRGIRPTGRIRGLPSDRALIDRLGIGAADVVLVPLEDGDRTEALVNLGKRVISIDINPLSRTSRRSDLPIVDDLGRALREITRHLDRMRRGDSRAPRAAFDRAGTLRDAVRRMRGGFRAPPRGETTPRARSGRRPVRGTPSPKRRRH